MWVMIRQVEQVSSLMREYCFDIMNRQVGNAGAFYLAIKDMVETGYWTMFVAEERGFVRGFITGTNYLGRAKIDNLYVDKRFHRQGIGTALVKAYQEYVDANGAEVLTVQTRPTQQAIDFYTKNGFERLKSSYLMQKML